MATHLKKMIEEHHVEFADLRFTDLRGKEHHVTLPAARADENLFKNGKVFDGSSLIGWQSINKSDLLLMPEAASAVLDPFCQIPTINLRCDVYDPATTQPYSRDPRSLAKRAEAYMKQTGVADTSYFGQEVEFFIFDDVRWDLSMNGCFYKLDSEEGAWNSGTTIEEGNMGFRPRVKGGYFPVPPVDSSHDLRSAICQSIAAMGLVPEVHHHEVATANQNEITMRYNTMALKSDEMQVFKYAAQNVALAHGKSITFMPKPLVGDNGSGLHCHQSLFKDGKNLFNGNGYAGLSDLALYYLGGIIKHGRALSAFTNPSTNSYKRLVPGYEAPVTLVYSAGNRSAAIRIPHAFSDKEKRIEVRFPDAMANPYLAFSALLMAGLDGIKNKIHPGEAVDEDLYHLPPEKVKSYPSLCASLDEALNSLEEDLNFLLEGGVFSHDILQSYIEVKRAEAARLNMSTHPVELDMYYDL